jgi:hypothetical protein
MLITQWERYRGLFKAIRPTDSTIWGSLSVKIDPQMKIDLSIRVTDVHKID